MTNFLERYRQAVEFYEAREETSDLARVLRTLLGPEPLDSQNITAYLLRSEDDAFRAFVVTPRQFIALEYAPNAARLLSTTALHRVSRVYEALTENTATVTIELDADILQTTTTGNFAYITPPVTPGEPPVTRGDLVLDAIAKRAFYAISSPRTEEAADAVDQLLEFSAHFRAALL